MSDADGFGGGGGGLSSPSHGFGSAAPSASSNALDLHSELIPEATRFDEALSRPLQLGMGEEILLPFVEEYSKLQQALAKSHESETRFVNKCKALTKQTRAHTHKLTALHAIHLQDSKRKTMLQSEIEKHKLLLTKLGEEIKEKKDGVRDLRQELSSLGASLEESSNDFLRSQRNAIAKLELEVNKYNMIRDKDRSSLTKIRSKNVELFKTLQDLLAACSRSQQEFDGLEAKLLEARALSGKELRRKAELEKHMKDVQLRVSDRQNQLSVKKELIAKATKDRAEIQGQFHKSQKVVELHRETYEALNEETRVANEELLAIQEANAALVTNLKRLLKEVEEDKGAAHSAKVTSEQKLKLLEAMRDKVRVMAEDTRVQEDAKYAAQSRLKLLKDQIAAIQFKLNTNAKAMDTCVREREVLAQNHSSKVDAIKSKEAALKIKHSTLQNIKNEHQGYLISIRALTKIMEDLKRDKAAHEVDLHRRLVQKARALEEVSARELQITEYQSQILINQGKLRQQQNLLEAVRSDRNLYRKTLIEQQSEMHEYKRRFHFLSTQVTQSKAEIEEKNQFIIFEHFNLQNVRDDMEQLETQNGNTGSNLSKAEGIIKTQSKQIRKLSTIIGDADEELRVQIHQYNQIVNEQRVLNAQLVKRNDELASLYEQLKLQNSILTKSAAHYKDKQMALHEFEAEYAAVNKTLAEVLGDIKKYVELRDTIAELETQLVQEQLKVKALSDELRKPINIHRWRRLMDTNTDTYGMIKKVRHLQSEIIAKTEAVHNKDEAIQEKEKLYVDLRRVLARQPGSEAAEQLRVYLEQLDEKRAKLKSMKSELRLYQTKVKEHQYDLSKLNGDLQLLKLAYFQKRRAQQRKANNAANGGGGGGGGGGGNAWRGDSAAGGGGGGFDSDMPDILRPTEFPTFPSHPPPEHGQHDGHMDYTQQQQTTQQQQQQQQQQRGDNQAQYLANPYLLSGNPAASAGSAAASSNPFPSGPSASHGARPLDEESDDEDQRDFRDEEREARMRELEEKEDMQQQQQSQQQSQSQSQQHQQQHQYYPQQPQPPQQQQQQQYDSRASLRSASRQSSLSAAARPESRGAVIGSLNFGAAAAASAQAASSAQLSQRSDSRNSARGTSAQSQRGDANFSRFPTIGGAAQ